MPKKRQVIYLNTFNKPVAIFMLIFASRFQIPELKWFSSRFAVLLADPLKPGVNSRKKMYLEQCRQAVLQLHLSDQPVHCLLRSG